MRAGTHLAFAGLLGVSAAGFGGDITIASGAALALGSLLPDVDTTRSEIGRFVKPLAGRLERRFGHRTLTHSLLGLAGVGIIASPLLVVHRNLWIALMTGCASHLLLDTANVSGVPLLWPHRVRFWLVGNRAWRVPYASAKEGAWFAVITVATLALAPLSLDGFASWFHRALGTSYGAVEDYGKTLQAISALRVLVQRAEVFGAAILCPKSLVTVWEDELAKWAPELLVAVLDSDMPAPQQLRQLASHHVVILNYEMLRQDDSVIHGRTIDVLIADEAHRLRNLESAVSSGLRRVRATRRWVISGTPLERDKRDLASVLSIIDTERFSPSDEQEESGILRMRAEPYTLRRTREAVLPDLPDVHYHHEQIALLPEQQSAYDAVRGTARGSDGEIISPLEIVTRLRMICDYELATEKSSKVERILQHLRTIADNAEKAVVFSHFLHPLRLVAKNLERAGLAGGYLILEGSSASRERSEIVSRFRSDPAISFLLASSRVGSEGLTLTEANHVLFVNQWWNPAANSQARDRVVRIGQKKDVHVYTFTCIGTIEENLEKILSRKENLFQEIVGKLAHDGRISPEIDEELAAELLADTLREP